jgi:polyhydroxyalkanoate synthase
VYGNCPAEFLQASFLLLKPVQNLIEKPIHFFEKADDPEAIDDFLTMETWLNDNIPVAGEVYREFVKYLYQENLLVQNKMPVGKHTVNLKKITCPVLNIMAKSDDLVPCAQSLPFNDLISSTDRKSIVIPAGHIGLAIGGKAQREVWPHACNWLAERS